MSLTGCCLYRRKELCAHLRQWHLKVIEIVKRGQHRKSLDKLFQGFKPAVEACYFSWEDAFPIPGITYNGAEKKTSFCWTKAMQHKGSKRAGEVQEVGGETRLPKGQEVAGGKGGLGDKNRSPHEMAVRPKDSGAKRKGGSDPSRGGGGTGRPVADTDKPVYKLSANKCKLPQAKFTTGKHSGKRRTSSEDSSLEPDLAELGLDDGNLALGAEACNTFDFDDPANSYKDLYPDETEGFFPESYEQDTSSGPSNRPSNKQADGASNGEQAALPPPELLSKRLHTEASDGPVAGDDDYQVYYLNPQEVAQGDEKPEECNDEEHDIFAGLKPLDQENRMEVFPLYSSINVAYV